VDVIAKPSDSAQRLGNIVAERLRLQPGWLNDDVRRFASIDGTFAPLQIQELEAIAKHAYGLRVLRAATCWL
jgi:hypothetical protein